MMLTPEELQAIADAVVRALPLNKIYVRLSTDIPGANAVLSEDRDRIVRVVQQYDIQQSDFRVLVDARFTQP